MDPLLVVTFYKFVTLDDHADLQAPIESCCRDNDVRGIVLLAQEGINSTIAGPRDSIMAVLDSLRSDPRLEDLTWKESSAETQPFRKLRVRLKKEIVTMGVPGIDPAQLVGTYVKPSEWNELISDPNVIVIDTRNDYEVEIGTARMPSIQTSSPSASCRSGSTRNWRSRAATTGGDVLHWWYPLRKVDRALKQAGVKEVYHLEGGILKYLEEVPEEESLWEGQCFVFDERVSVGHGLEVGEYELCRACRFPLNASDKQSELFKIGVGCPRCHDHTSDEQKARYAERQKQVELARARGERPLRPTDPADSLGCGIHGHRLLGLNHIDGSVGPLPGDHALLVDMHVLDSRQEQIHEYACHEDHHEEEQSILETRQWLARWIVQVEIVHD